MWVGLTFASHKWTEVLGGFVSKIFLSPHNTKRMVSGPSHLLYFSLKLSARVPPPFRTLPGLQKEALGGSAAVVRCLTCCVVPVRLVAHRTEGMFLGLSYAKQKQNQICLKCSLSLEGSPLVCPVREEWHVSFQGIAEEKGRAPSFGWLGSSIEASWLRVWKPSKLRVRVVLVARRHP